MSFQHILLGIVAVLTARLLFFVYKSLISPLRSIPGPFWTRFSRIWYLYRVWLGHFEQDNIALHQKLGPIVRIAPNHYSINDPSAVKTIYGIGSKFPKSTWYEGWKHPSPDRWTLFPDQNIKRHAETRRLFQGLYSMSSLVNYELYVDQCAEVFMGRLTEAVNNGREINMAHWFQCYAFDVIGNITYSRRFGFLDHGEDIEHAMGALHNSMSYSTLVGIYPEYHPMLFELLSHFSRSGAAGRLKIMKFTDSLFTQRRNEKAGIIPDPVSDDNITKDLPQDFFEKMMIAKQKAPEKVTDYHIFMMGLSNIIAGSDTTSTSLSAILYNLLRYPRTFDKLRQEVDQFQSEGRCSYPNVTFKESQAMPYLQAVIKEALRIHSATGLPLWRVVPEGGTTLSGQFFPEGTVVGINTWVAHYSKEIFGEDADQFRPERWIEAEEQGGDKLRRMESYYMPFGLGSRTCLGKNISLLEMSKLIPQIVQRFDFELSRPDEPWDTLNYWFVLPTNFDVKVRFREMS